MVLDTQRDAAGLLLNKLSFDAPTGNIDARGTWHIVVGRHASRFDIDVRSPELGKLLASFGYAVADLDGGKTEMQIRASWPGTPADFDLANLDGTLKLKVESGRLVEVENRVGRIFGLLSINTIWRRLSLDFSDLFKKGFAFDLIEGEFRIEKGDAYTDDLKMIGPSATVEVEGRTGLARQDYDQTVTVTPAFASNLPVASALFGPAGMGVGAAVLLAEKVFPSIPENIDKLLRSEYSITGSWENPIVKPKGEEH
jgi:uncharacterized protein YhdP